jgi:hypothetical protein
MVSEIRFRMPWVHRKHLDLSIYACNGTDTVWWNFLNKKLTN